MLTPCCPLPPDPAAILLEIQDTLREPPKAVRTMRTVIIWSLGISFGFYLLISIMG